MINIGDTLKKLRLEENLTQEAVAKKLGISRVNYTRYENDTVRPSYETLIKIAQLYNVTIDYIFGLAQL